jgi:hypothetical protein
MQVSRPSLSRALCALAMTNGPLPASSLRAGWVNEDGTQNTDYEFKSQSQGAATSVNLASTLSRHLIGGLTRSASTGTSSPPLHLRPTFSPPARRHLTSPTARFGSRSSLRRRPGPIRRRSSGSCRRSSSARPLLDCHAICRSNHKREAVTSAADWVQIIWI